MVAADEGEIADLAVAPWARRRGVGGLLLDLAAADARDVGVRTLYLEVRESNAAAIALYESRGFGTIGRRRQYYRHPMEDALVLRRDLSAS
jgi:ribosomal-protein-alanine N-acetyltransferase